MAAKEMTISPEWQKALDLDTVRGYLDYAEYCERIEYNIGIAWGLSGAGKLLFLGDKFEDCLPYLEDSDRKFSQCNSKTSLVGEDMLRWVWVCFAIGFALSSNEVKNYRKAKSVLEKGLYILDDDKKFNSDSVARAKRIIEFCNYMMK